MTDYRAMYDSDFLHHYDLPAKEVDAEIERVEAGELTGQGGRKSKKPLCYFKGKKKALALNKTNGKAIAAIVGTPDTAKWPGTKVCLFVTTTEMAGETVECIRVKPCK